MQVYLHLPPNFKSKDQGIYGLTKFKVSTLLIGIFAWLPLKKASSCSKTGSISFWSDIERLTDKMIPRDKLLTANHKEGFVFTCVATLFLGESWVLEEVFMFGIS